MEKDLKIVYDYQKEIGLIWQALALLSWDEQTYMPKEAVEGRAEQSAYLSALSHKKMISNNFFSAVKRLRNSKIKGDEKIMVDKLYKGISKARRIPESFVKEMAMEVTLSGQAWLKARRGNNFKIFEPHLQKLVDLKKQEAKYAKLSGHLYNGLLDDFEEGMTVEKIIPIFDKLRDDLVDLIDKIKSSKKYKSQKLNLMKGKFDKKKLEFFVRDVANRMGLKEGFSRIDLSEHPFTTKVGLNDIRFTTAYRENPMFAFLSTVHEAGHALYESGMPKKDIYNILGGAPSVGLHESQSRFWENNIARSLPFWKYYYPKFKKDFKINGNFEKWFDEVNFVYPNKIRVEADEVHYCLHIILRFEIETGLVDGSIKVKDLPRIWNEKMKKYFGVIPKNYVEGVLQDVHWSMGAFGYFPTYALGTIYSAQIFEKLKKEYPNMAKDLREGNFDKIGEWLKKYIHRYGSRYKADDLIKKVTGEGLNSEIYINYLTEKYKKIYEF